MPRLGEDAGSLGAEAGQERALSTALTSVPPAPVPQQHTCTCTENYKWVGSLWAGLIKFN